ncbi:MAG: Smr/MutS family protein [Thermodesulfobacteriota bacterium]
MHLCQVCGNEIDPGLSRCPHCGSVQEHGEGGLPGSGKLRQKSINLEQGLPTVAQALQHLEQVLAAARSEQIRLLTLIHGYGSSGKGGAIRQECRKTLDYLCRKGEVAAVIFGEDFSRRHGPAKQLLHRFPELSSHPHLNRQNRGITLVLLF